MDLGGEYVKFSSNHGRHSVAKMKVLGGIWWQRHHWSVPSLDSN